MTAPTTLYAEAMQALLTGRLIEGGNPPPPGFGTSIAKSNAGRVMREAKIIRLDRSAIRAAVATSMLPPAEFLRVMQRAIPPFPTVWVEWDEVARLEALREFDDYREVVTAKDDPASSASRVGYLVTMSSDPGGAPSWGALPWFAFRHPITGKDSIGASQIGVGWQPSGPVAGNDDDVLAEGILAKMALGSIYSRTHDSDPVLMDVLRHTSISMGAGITPDDLGRAQPLRGKDKAVDGWLRTISNSSKIIAGDLRFIVSVMGLWHTRARDLSPPQADRVRHKSRTRGWRYEAIEFHTLTVDLPRAVRDIDTRRTASPGDADRAPPRQHDVAGHWCQSHRTPGKKWFRRAHQRGDAARGVIAKDYAATATHLTTRTPEGTDA